MKSWIPVAVFEAGEFNLGLERGQQIEKLNSPIAKHGKALVKRGIKLQL